MGQLPSSSACRVILISVHEYPDDCWAFAKMFANPESLLNFDTSRYSPRSPPLWSVLSYAFHYSTLEKSFGQQSKTMSCGVGDQSQKTNRQFINKLQVENCRAIWWIPINRKMQSLTLESSHCESQRNGAHSQLILFFVNNSTSSIFSAVKGLGC